MLAAADLTACALCFVLAFTGTQDAVNDAQLWGRGHAAKRRAAVALLAEIGPQLASTLNPKP